MADINNGADSTLLRDTLSSRLLESFFLVEQQAKEQEQNRVTITTNFNANTATVNFNFEVVPVVDELGNVILSAKNYLDDFGFLPGEGSDIKGDNLIQNIFEMLNLVSIYENDPVRNPSSTSRLTATYNYATSAYSGTMSFNLNTRRTNSGAVELYAQSYLN